MTNNLGIAAYRHPMWCPVQTFPIPYTLAGCQHQVMAYVWGNPEEERTLFCVHGIFQTGLFFQYLAAYLSPAYRVIALDLPGRGLSEDLPRTFHNLETYHDIMKQVLSYLKIDSYDFCGTSLGGLLAYRLAADQTPVAELRRMVINDVAPLVPISTVTYLRDIALWQLRPFPSLSAVVQASQALPRVPYQDREDVQAFLNHLYCDIYQPFASPEGLVWRRRFSERLVPQEGEEASMHDLAETPGFVGHWSEYEVMSVPFLLLHGPLSTVLTDELVAEMKARQPHLLHYHAVPGATHVPMLCTEEECTVIADFLLDNQ